MSFTTENLSSNPGTGNGTRITMVLSSLVGGGAERVAADLCRYLSEAGRDVTLLTLTGDDPDAYSVPEGTRRERIEIRHDATSPFWRLRFVVSRHLAMRRKIRAFRPDVVVSFIDQINIRTILCLLGTGIPVIVSERVHPAHVLLGPTWRLVRRLCYPLAAAVTVQTADGAAWLRNYARIKGAVVIPNAV